MTATANRTAVTNTPSTESVESLLRDAAFVLRMTRRVKNEMLLTAEPRSTKTNRDTEQPTIVAVA